MYKIHIFMQCAPDPYEFFQSIFGLRAFNTVYALIMSTIVGLVAMDF